jgi:hypothetical protein
VCSGHHIDRGNDDPLFVRSGERRIEATMGFSFMNKLPGMDRDFLFQIQ